MTGRDRVPTNDMSTLDFANKFVELIRAGDYETIYRDHYSPDILSVEADGQEYRGMADIEKKNAWWAENFEVHGEKVEGPFPHGDQFALIFEMDITHKPSGQRSQMREVAVYQLREGRVAEERFFYPS